MPPETHPVPPAPAGSTDVAQANGRVVEALANLPTIGAAPSDADIAAMNVAYGKDLNGFAQAAAAVMENSGEAYRGLPFTAGQLIAQALRAAQLGEFRDTLASGVAQVTIEYNAARVDLAGKIGQVYTATDAIKNHPGVAPEVKKTVIIASGRLYTLRDTRRTERTTAAVATRTRNAFTAIKDAAKDGAIATLSGQLADKDLENRFLSGQSLRPDDLSALPQTPSAAFKAPPPAAAPLSRRRPGRGPRR